MFHQPHILSDEQLAHRVAAAMAVVMNQRAADAFALGRCPTCRDPKICRAAGCPRGVGLAAANSGRRIAGRAA